MPRHATPRPARPPPTSPTRSLPAPITYTPYFYSPRRADTLNEQGIKDAFINKLRDLKYIDRPAIHDRAALESNFR